MQSRIFTFLLFFMVAVNTTVLSQKTYTGNYEVSEPSLIMKADFFLKGVRHVVSGSSLHLKEDSSFIYTTCGNIMTGKWTKQKETVSLTVQSNRYRIDSLNAREKLEVPQKPIVYITGKNYLYRLSSAGDKTKALEFLGKK